MKFIVFLIFCAYSFASDLNISNVGNTAAAGEIYIEENSAALKKLSRENNFSAPPEEISKETSEETAKTMDAAKSGAEVKNARKPIAPIEKMIAQMIAVGFEGVKPSDEWVKAARDQIRAGMVGSVAIYARNVVSPTQLRSLTESLHYSMSGGAPLWVMTSQEGGSAQSLAPAKGFGAYPSAKNVSKLAPAKAYALYRDLACELRGYAINFNLSPIVDLDVEGSRLSRDSRSFSSSAETAAAYAEQFINAHNSCGVWTAIKRFSNREADQAEPFKSLMAGNAAGALIISREQEDQPTISSLSKKRIDRIRSLGFNGLIISDDLQSGSNTRELNQTILSALNAGADILLFPNAFSAEVDIPSKAQEIIKGAIESGDIELARIEESYTRIIKQKSKIPQ